MTKPTPWGRPCSPPAAWRCPRSPRQQRSGAGSCCSSQPAHRFYRSHNKHRQLYSNLSVVGSCERNISKIHIIFTSPMSAPSLINLFTVSSCNIHKRFDHWQSTAVRCYPPGWGWWPAWGECCHWPRHTGPGHTSSPAAAAHQNMRTSSSIELQTNVHEDRRYHNHGEGPYLWLWSLCRRPNIMSIVYLPC